MLFSRRSQVSEEGAAAAGDISNALSRALAEARAGGGSVLDLTVSNPTAAGLPYDADAIAQALAESLPEALLYAPDPLGIPGARAAVAEHHRARGIDLAPSRIAITASTSEAYATLFKLFCDPGDEVLVPVPSYPLLAWLAAFEGVELRTYPLSYVGHWQVDLAALARAVGPRTRAIVVVSPNNPTGSYLGRDELHAMLDLGLPIVSDEVFATYPLAARGIPEHRVDTVLRATRGLVFALSGLSKLCALPQLKVGWIACGGDGAQADEAMARLEVVLDAYLSVGAPVQHALGALLRAGTITSDAIRSRTRANLAIVRSMAAGTAMTVLDVEGGWYATLRVPETMTDEEWALALVREDGVYVHPGYFFDLQRGAHLVVSLLTPEAVLREGMARIAARVSRA